MKTLYRAYTHIAYVLFAVSKLIYRYFAPKKAF